MRVALYLRVSTTGQEIANQYQALERECQRLGWHISFLYQEQASGLLQRDALEGALRDAESHHFDVLFFWSLDRLTREGPLKTLLYLERLTRAGVKFKSYREPWLDATNPTGELLIPIFAWIAKQESLRRGERIRAAFERIREGGNTRSGRPIGRPRRHIPQKTVQQALGLRSQGWPWQTIARKLQVPSTSLLRAIPKTPLTKHSKHGHF